MGKNQKPNRIKWVKTAAFKRKVSKENQRTSTSSSNKKGKNQKRNKRTSFKQLKTLIYIYIKPNPR